MLTTILYIILAVLILTTIYVVVRTILFQWSYGAIEQVEGLDVDDQLVAEHLAACVRCQTVPLDDSGTPDPEAFQQLHQMLQETYPLVHQKLKREVVNGYSLLYTWQGTRSDLEPIMLMAHQDVVSADPSDWTNPPFDGVIIDGFIWGRGTLDIKNQLIGIMEAAEALLQQGYRPERTILFGLGHDEETGGVNGCKVMGQMLKDRGVRLAGIVDEGGGISAGLAAGVRGEVALIGVSEKGYLTVEFTVNSQPGIHQPHLRRLRSASSQKLWLAWKPTQCRLTCAACARCIVGLARQPHLSAGCVCQHLAVWPVVEALACSNPEMNASMRTTTALTIIKGGVEDNTIPAEAKAIVNFRLLPGDSIADVLWHAKKVIKDERVKFKPVEGKFNEALPISSNSSPAYKGLKTVIRQVFNNPPVAPFVMLGGTDCQHFVPVCDNIYRFTSLAMDESFRGLEHGIDERIPINGMAKMVIFMPT